MDGPELTILSVHPDTREATIAFSALDAAAKDLPLKVKIDRIPFDKLDFGETSALDRFYNADVVVGDLSEHAHRAPLFYQLGVRDSFGMHHNIVTFLDKDQEETLALLKVKVVTAGCGGDDMSVCGWCPYGNANSGGSVPYSPKIFEELNLEIW